MATTRRILHPTRPGIRLNQVIGQIGDRRTFAGTVRYAGLFDGDHGPQTLLIIDTSEGAVKWWAAGDWVDERGEEISVRATVGAHEFYNDRVVTVINRGSID